MPMTTAIASTRRKEKGYPTMNGYVCFYKGKRWECHADTTFEAQQKAAEHFKAKKRYDVTVMLAEINGKQATHKPMF